MQARSGRSVEQALQQVLHGVQGELKASSANLGKLDEATRQLVEQRGQALLDLAEHYLPDIDRQTVAGTFSEVRGELLQILDRKERHEQELRTSLAEDQTKTSELEDSLKQITTELNAKVARREELEKSVVQKLETDTEFQRLSQEALIAEQNLDQNEKRVAEIRSESAQKLPSYERSRLFQYLHKRGYGTAEYKKTGLTKRLDRWVAGMINYARARRSYDFLRVTPELMSQEVERRRDQFNGLMEQLETIEDRYADEIGLTDVMREGQALGGKRDQIVSAIASQQAITAKHLQELTSLQSSRNDYYEQALKRMQEFLANLEDRHLQSVSRSTPEPQDDKLVGEIVGLGAELQQHRHQSEQISYQQQFMKDRASGLQEIWNHFHQADFDSQRSLFPENFPIESHLEQYVRGELGLNDLWSTIKNAQQFAPPWYEDPGRDMRKVFDSDFSYVLLRVLTDIAGHALRNAASRGVQRRGPIRQQQRVESGRPQFRNRGFTSGRGF